MIAFGDRLGNHNYNFLASSQEQPDISSWQTTIKQDMEAMAVKAASLDLYLPTLLDHNVHNPNPAWQLD